MAPGNHNLRIPITMKLSEAKIAALLSIALLVPELAWAASPGPEDARWLAYEPTVVTLSGVLAVQLEFGPPNYGEDPATDAKLEVPILALKVPISVRGNPDDQLNNATVTDVRKVQLIFLSGADGYTGMVGKSVTVTGTLSEAMTGHHYTPVVLTVKTIHEAR